MLLKELDSSYLVFSVFIVFHKCKHALMQRPFPYDGFKYKYIFKYIIKKLDFQYGIIYFINTKICISY
jgi:hypothetical protein